MNKSKLISWEDVRKEHFTDEEIREINKKVAYNVLVRKLKYARQSMNLSQEQLSLLSGVPRSTIAKVENGKQNVSILKLQQIIEPMNMDLNIELVPRK